MLNLDNAVRICPREQNPLQQEVLSSHGSFACRRPIGEGYYDPENDLTYVAWNERGMDIWMNTYDHRLKKWSEPEQVAQMGLFDRWDYHDYITMIPGKNGRPIFFYNIHSSHAVMIKEGPDGTWVSRVISEEQNDYPAPIRYGDTIYFFYSENKEISYPYRPLKMIKSTDDGETWTRSRVIVDSQKLSPTKMDEVYQCSAQFAPATREHPDEILLTWTMWGGPRHAMHGQGAYCAAMHLDDEKLYDVEGKCFGGFVDYRAMREDCLIDEAPIAEAEPHNVTTVIAQQDAKGRIVAVYGQYEQGKTFLKQAEKSGGRWQPVIFAEDSFNVKDLVRQGDRLLASTLTGDAVTLYQKGPGDSTFTLESITRIHHTNGSNAVPYLNFLDTGRADRVMLLMGLIQRENIPQLYDGLWNVTVLHN